MDVISEAARWTIDQTALDDALNDLANAMHAELLPEPRARLMNQAGDLCFHAGQRERALLYFDAAIDLYLSAGQFAASAAICEKLVRLNPTIVRARCTLAWLAIARGLDDEAARHVDDYGTAALRLERPTVAQRQLRAMVEEVDSDIVLEAIARTLDALGDAPGAARVRTRAQDPFRARKRYPSPEDRNRAIISRLTTAWGG